MSNIDTECKTNMGENEQSDYRMTLPNGFWQVFVTCICFVSQWIKRSKHRLFIFPPEKTLMWRRHVRLANRVAV